MSSQADKDIGGAPAQVPCFTAAKITQVSQYRKICRRATYLSFVIIIKFCTILQTLYWNKCEYKILCSNLNGMTNIRSQNTNLKLYCLNSQQELTEIKLNMRACFVKSVGIRKHRSRQNSRIYCLTLYEKKA